MEGTADVQKWREQTARRMVESQQLAIAKDQAMIARNAAAYNRNRYEVQFSKEQLLWVFRDPSASQSMDPTRRTRKLEPSATGPWRVVDRLANNNYRLRNTRTGAIDEFNVDTLVPVTVTEWSGPLQASTPETDDDEFTDPFDSGNDSDNDPADDSADDSAEVTDATLIPKKGGCSATQVGCARTLRPVPERLARRAALAQMP